MLRFCKLQIGARSYDDDMDEVLSHAARKPAFYLEEEAHNKKQEREFTISCGR